MIRRKPGSKRRGKRPAALRPIVCSASPVVSVIIPAANERRTIASVIRHSRLVHPDTEVIVVANGSSDGTARIAERLGARVIRYENRLGHDVGRSIGARAAKGDILLFVDGDFAVPARDLRPLVKAVKDGRTDVALNSYLGSVDKAVVHEVVLAKHALNAALGRPDLKGASMTTVPHAIHRQAAEAIGFEHLSVPPKAQAIAIARGLRIRPVHFIHVGKKNRKRKKRRGEDPVGDLIVGDHLEAMQWHIERTGNRGGFHDHTRDRTKLRWDHD